MSLPRDWVQLGCQADASMQDPDNCFWHHFKSSKLARLAILSKSICMQFRVEGRDIVPSSSRETFAEVRTRQERAIMLASFIIREDLKSQSEHIMVFKDLENINSKLKQASNELEEIGLREDFGERCVLQRAVHDVGSKIPLWKVTRPSITKASCMEGF